MDRISKVARRMWDCVEPIAANVYFAPEAHTAYHEIGFEGSSRTVDGVQYPDGIAYFVSRGACLGHVPGEVIAAAFGVFKRPMVVAAVSEGWSRTDPPTVLAAREKGATASLCRILGAEPPALGRATGLLARTAEAAGGEGRALYSGLSSLGYPGFPMGDFWRAADLVREHRGDSHIVAWVSAGLDACEIGLLTDPWRGAPLRSWVRSRGWTDEELEAGIDRLRSRGLIEGEGLTDKGRRHREDIETATDMMERGAVDALGDDAAELFSILEPWRDAVIEAKGYPRVRIPTQR